MLFWSQGNFMPMHSRIITRITWLTRVAVAPAVVTGVFFSVEGHGLDHGLNHDAAQGLPGGAMITFQFTPADTASNALSDLSFMALGRPHPALLCPQSLLSRPPNPSF
jgi:hypothetical protein